MSKIINTSEAPEKANLPVRVKVIAGIALAVLAGVGFFAFSPALRTSVSNGYADLVDPPRGVCGKDRELLNSYSQAAKAKEFKKVVDIAKAVRQKADYQSDPTCLYISVVAYTADSDTRSSFKDFDALLQFEKDGKLPSRRIDDGIKKTDLYNTVKKFQDEKPENQRGEG